MIKELLSCTKGLKGVWLLIAEMAVFFGILFIAALLLAPRFKKSEQESSRTSQPAVSQEQNILQAALQEDSAKPALSKEIIKPMPAVNPTVKPRPL